MKNHNSFSSTYTKGRWKLLSCGLVSWAITSSLQESASSDSWWASANEWCSICLGSWFYYVCHAMYKTGCFLCAKSSEPHQLLIVPHRHRHLPSTHKCFLVHVKEDAPYSRTANTHASLPTTYLERCGGHSSSTMTTTSEVVQHGVPRATFARSDISLTFGTSHWLWGHPWPCAR